MRSHTGLHITIIFSVAFAAVEWGSSGFQFGVAILFAFGLGVFIGQRVTPGRW